MKELTFSNQSLSIPLGLSNAGGIRWDQVRITRPAAPAAARAGFVLDASIGKPYQVTSPRAWGQSNLMLTPGYAPSLPILSMFQLQLDQGLVDLDGRPMVLLKKPPSRSRRW